MPHSLAESTVWGDLPTWVGLGGAAIAFAIGLRQYRVGQQWKRSEFVAGEMQKFFEDPKVAAALLLLDYSAIRLNEKGEPVSKGQAGEVFTDALLISALRCHRDFVDQQEEFLSHEMFAREAFDSLLSGLERFDHYIVAGLLTEQDLDPYLGYWINVMSNPASAWKDPAFYPRMKSFVENYGYEGVADLFSRFQRRRFAVDPLPSG